MHSEGAQLHTVCSAGPLLSPWTNLFEYHVFVSSYKAIGAKQVYQVRINKHSQL